MKIEVGMYIRYDGEISTITFINEKCCEGIEIVKSRFHLKTGKVLDYPKDKFVVSNNIIDLIEVGDYANGYYVSKIWKDGEITHYVDKKTIRRKEKQITIQAPSYGGIIHLHNEDIKSIVTKEQFESMKYRIGE